MKYLYKMKTVSVPAIGTLGTIYKPEGPILCRTVEREWLNNQASISCIPAGMYEVVWTDSPSHGKILALQCFELGVSIVGPTPRTHILIHVANFPKDVEGCIGVGNKFMTNFGVGNSRNTLPLVEQDMGEKLDRGDQVFIQIDRSHAE